MSIESQKLLEVLQYICFAGLILPGLAVFVMPDFRKKAICLFIMFIFITVLSFLFYAGIILFIVSTVFIFVFMILYLLTQKVDGLIESGNPDSRRKTVIIKATEAVVATLLCAGLGYAIFDISTGYFTGVEEIQEIYITSLKDITESVFTGYSIVIIFLIAAAFITFTGFTVFQKNRQKDGEA